jgi:hypothetical protein
VQAPLSLILNQLTAVFWFLVLKRHRMDDALHIATGAFARRAFREFLKRAGLRDEAIDKVAAHGFGDLSQGGQRDAVSGFRALEQRDAFHAIAEHRQASALSIIARAGTRASRIHWSKEHPWITASCDPPKFEYEGAFRSWLLRILIDEALIILREKEQSTSHGNAGNRHNY